MNRGKHSVEFTIDGEQYGTTAKCAEVFKECCQYEVSYDYAYRICDRLSKTDASIRVQRPTTHLKLMSLNDIMMIASKFKVKQKDENSVIHKKLNDYEKVYSNISSIVESAVKYQFESLFKGQLIDEIRETVKSVIDETFNK